jgi:hypothetical protein
MLDLRTRRDFSSHLFILPLLHYRKRNWNQARCDLLSHRQLVARLGPRLLGRLLGSLSHFALFFFDGSPSGCIVCLCLVLIGLKD